MTPLEEPLCPLILNFIRHKSTFLLSTRAISLLVIATSSLQCPCIENRQGSSSALGSMHEYGVFVEYFEEEKDTYFCGRIEMEWTIYN